MGIFSGVILFLSVAINAQAVPASGQKLTIGLIGDSTVADTYGWGPAFADRFNDQVTVLNSAKNGATLESLSSTLDELLKHNPDYVFIQFGHNDQKRYDPEVYSVKLGSYVDRIKKVGAKAVILSSVTRRYFDEDGKIITNQTAGVFAALSAYAEAAQNVARDENVAFIDLYTISVEHHNQIGPEASATYNFNGTDRTHFSEAGANAIADLIIKELQNVVPELAIHLKRLSSCQPSSLKAQQPGSSGICPMRAARKVSFAQILT